MGGRKPQVSLEHQKEVFNNFKDTLKLPLPPLSDKVYEEIFLKLNCKMSKKAIYLSIKKNFNFFFDVTTDNLASISKHDEQDGLSVSSDSDWNCDSIKNTNSYVNNFEVDIHTWRKIQPNAFYTKRSDHSKPYSLYHKKYFLRGNAWTSIFREELWKNIKSPCNWIFKNHQVKSEFEISTCGICKQCSAKIMLHTKMKSENFIQFDYTIFNFNAEFHHSPLIKVRSTTLKKNKLCELLRNKPASVVHKTLSTQLHHDDIDAEPSILPKLETLRKMKQRHKMSLFFNVNVILSLQCMCYTPPYNKIIQRFSVFPFYIYYWTQEQIRYYENCINNYNNLRISIDATGSIFKKILLPPLNDYTEKFKTYQKHKFLYQVMTDTVKKASIPLCQMISENHDMISIRNWLSTWLQGRTPPKEVITDDSSALIGAAVQSFTRFTSTQTYLEHAFKILEGNTTDLPECFLRLDKSHFIKKLYNLTVLNNVDVRVKFFYIQCIKLIQKCEFYDQVKLIIRDVIITSLYKFRGITDNGNLSHAEQSIARLKSTLQKYNVTDEEEIDVVNTYEVDDNDYYPTSATFTNSKNMMFDYCSAVINFEKQHIDENNRGGLYENIYYLPNFHSTLVRLLNKLPMWGSVINSFFKAGYESPSSSNCESYFKDIKKYIVESDDRVRIDEFIIKHSTHITGALKLALDDSVVNRSDMGLPKKNEKELSDDESSDGFDSSSIFMKHPRTVENWRGKALKDKKRTTIVHILKNGNMSTSGIEGTLIYNTCAFDSVAQSFAYAYKDRKAFKSYLKDLNDETSRFIKSLLTSQKEKSANGIYVKRSQILLKHFKSDTFESVNDDDRDTNNMKTNETMLVNDDIDHEIEIGTSENIKPIIKSVDCQCNVSKIIEQILGEHFFSALRVKECSNKDCEINNNNPRKCSYLPINIDTIQKEGIASLNSTAEASLEEESKPCTKCKYGYCKFKYELNNVLFFEFNYEISTEVKKIPELLKLGDKSYRVLSAIIFESTKKDTMGHYKSLIYRHLLRKWQLYDDLKSKCAKSPSFVIPHCIIYTKIN